MQVVGKVTNAVLAEMQRRGLTPKQGVGVLLQEAKRRHPDASIILQKSAEGFDLVAL